MKQTAVEKMIQYFIKQKNNGASHWCIDDLIAQLHQAKEMEKEQIKNSYIQGFKYRDTWGWELETDWEIHSNKENEQSFEQYYNETFKSE